MEKTLPTGWFGGTYTALALRRDLIAGLTVAAVAVPQAMAYALIAGVPPQYGLYTAIIMTALASLFGSSSHLINGPTNAISLVVFSAIASMRTAPEGIESSLQAVFLLSILVGVIQIVIALLKLGDLTRYISESVILGFMAGAGILVALEQVHNLLGLRTPQNASPHFLLRFWQTMTQGEQVNLHATVVGVGTVLLILALQRLNAVWRLALPDLLIALLLSSLLVWSLGWSEKLDVIGELPRSLPRFHWPKVEARWVQDLSWSALSISLLGLLEALAIAKSIAARTHESLDYNRQCLAEGLANVGGGLFQCIPGSGSLTRSSVNFESGAMTRLSGVYSAAAVAATLLLFAPMAKFIPKPALAGILMVIAWRLVDRPRLMYCLRATRFDRGLALATAGAALFISIEFSILIGTFLSFLFFVPRAARLQVTELVLSPERVVRERQPDDLRCTKMALFSLEGELFFGAAPELDEHLQELIRRADEGARVIVLRLKRVRNPDMVCLERLQHFMENMKKRGVPVLFCGVREDFAEALRNVRVQQWLPPECLFLEEATSFSSTLRAIRRAYEIIDGDRCPHCPREREEYKGDWYYMI